jgi:hypothetical protein
VEATFMSPFRARALVVSLLVTVVVAGTSAVGSATSTTTTSPRTSPRTSTPRSTPKPSAAATTTTTATPRSKPRPAATATTTAAPKQLRTITYSIATAGKVTTRVEDFARQVAETLADARGWSRANLVFTRVATGGRFTVWLSAAGRVPSFGKPCDAVYSCRAGRNVVINEDRWKGATASWTKVGATLREYRNLVVNHEVGHWLGQGHGSCRRAGAPAPVMQQQSKDLGGCVANAWPLDREIANVRVPT